MSWSDSGQHGYFSIWVSSRCWKVKLVVNSAVITAFLHLFMIHNKTCGLSKGDCFFFSTSKSPTCFQESIKLLSVQTALWEIAGLCTVKKAFIDWNVALLATVLAPVPCSWLILTSVCVGFSFFSFPLYHNTNQIKSEVF